MPTYLAYSGSKFGYINGVSDYSFSTPDSAALDCTTAVALMFDGALDNWSAASTTLCCKADNFSTQLSYVLGVSGGVLAMQGSTDGTYNVGAFSVVSTVNVTTVATNFANLCVGATWSANVAKFWTAPSGTTTAPGQTGWTQLGANVTATLAGNLFNSTSLFKVGNRIAGLTLGFVGKVNRVKVYNAIDGTGLVSDFNPALFTSGTTFTASTGEVWTRNAGAYIGNGGEAYFDGTADYLKSAPYSLSQPESVYFVGSQVSWTANDYIYDGNSSDSRLMYQQLITSQIRIFAGGLLPTNSDWALGAKAVVSAVFNGASSSNRVNRGTTVTGNAGGASSNGFTLGTRGQDPTICSNITWSEALLRSAADNTALQLRIAAFEMWKWGIS
jgi:hypothetical protein